MKCIINGRIVLKDKVVDNCAIVFSDKIEKIVSESEINTADYEIIDVL